jgi:hypothetical protein
MDTAKTNNSLCSFVINLLISSLHDIENTAKLASSYNAPVKRIKTFGYNREAMAKLFKSD